MRNHVRAYFVVLLICVMPLLSHCGGGDEPEPTATPLPPTATTVPPTAVPEPEVEPTEPPAEEEEEEAEEAEEAEEEAAESSETASAEGDEEEQEAAEEAPSEGEAGSEGADESADTEPADTEAEAGGDYPAPVEVRASSEEYPAPAMAAAADAEPVAYPTAVPCPGTQFDINEPLEDGDTVVSGFGVEGTGIELVSVTYMGEIVGEAVIQDDGSFEAELTTPLSSNHLIGIRLVSTPSDTDQQEFIDSTIWPCVGDNVTDFPVPSIGLLLDSAQVQ